MDCKVMNGSLCRACKQCKSQKPCAGWDWESSPGTFPELQKVLQKARDTAEEWVSGPKSRTRGPGVQSSAAASVHDTWWTLSDVEKKLNSVPTRVCGLFVGIDEYADPNLGNLRNAVQDAKLLWEQTKAVSSAQGDALVFPEGLRFPEKAFLDRSGMDTYLKEWHTALKKLQKVQEPPQIVLFYFAGHGRGSDLGEYVLMSDFEHGDNDNESFEDKSGCMGVKDIIKRISRHVSDETHKYFLFDTCRVYRADEPSLREYAVLPTNTLLAFPVPPGEETKDGNMNSPFCKALAEHIFEPEKPLWKLIFKSFNAATKGGLCAPDVKFGIAMLEFQHCLARKCPAQDATARSADSDIIMEDVSRHNEEVVPALSCDDDLLKATSAGSAPSNNGEAVPLSTATTGQGNELQGSHFTPFGHKAGTGSSPRDFKDRELQKFIEAKIIEHLFPDGVHEKICNDKKSRCKTGAADVLAGINHMAECLSTMHLGDFMGVHEFVANNSCKGLGSYMDEYILPARHRPIKDLDYAEDDIKQIPTLCTMEQESFIPSQTDADKALPDCGGDWRSRVKISVYSKCDATAAPDLISKLEATMSMYVDVHGAQIQKLFEKRERASSESCFRQLKEWFGCSMREQAGLVMDTEMQNKMLAEALQHNDVIRVEPMSIIQVGTGQLESMARFYKLMWEYDQKPHVTLEEIYTSSSFVAVLSSTRFSAWLLFTLLEYFVYFRQEVSKLGLVACWFDEWAVAKCLCDEGRVVKSCRVDLDSKVSSIYTCICTHTRIVYTK
jgi:hypothetical protein